MSCPVCSEEMPELFAVRVFQHCSHKFHRDCGEVLLATDFPCPECTRIQSAEEETTTENLPLPTTTLRQPSSQPPPQPPQPPPPQAPPPPSLAQAQNSQPTLLASSNHIPHRPSNIHTPLPRWLCTICNESLSAAECVRISSNCPHNFHQACATTLQSTGYHCPACTSSSTVAMGLSSSTVMLNLQNKFRSLRRRNNSRVGAASASSAMCPLCNASLQDTNTSRGPAGCTHRFHQDCSGALRLAGEVCPRCPARAEETASVGSGGSLSFRRLRRMARRRDNSNLRLEEDSAPTASLREVFGIQKACTLCHGQVKIVECMSLSVNCMHDFHESCAEVLRMAGESCPVCASSRSGTGPVSQQMEECAICCEEIPLDADENGMRTLSCAGRHVFHGNCISQWLSSNSTCPICRQEVEN